MKKLLTLICQSASLSFFIWIKIRVKLLSENPCHP